ncbi:MAG: C45 family peptidase [Patescibacteria group bacterium]|nr:C45 family peptidase [Patescibacteria group bacterium]
MNGKLQFRNSYIESIDGIDYLSLDEKNYYDTGFATGILLAKSGYKIIKLLRNPLVKILLWLLYLKYKIRIKGVSIPEEYQDELNGCADAIKVRYKYLLFINLIYEIKGCSGFAFYNPDGTLLLAHNTDVPEFWAKFAMRYMKPLVTKVSIPGKNCFVHVSHPLMLGALNGYNDKGIAISSHDAGGVYAKIIKGNTSASCAVKIILESAKNLTDVQEIARRNPTYYPRIMIVASEKENLTSILEEYPSDYNFINAKGCPYIFSTNHYQSQKMRQYHREFKKGSLDRLTCLMGSLSGKKTLSVQEAIEILKDHRNGIQRDTTGYSIANIGTIQSFVFDITNGCIYISNSNKLPVSLHGNFVKVHALL